jgi:hypothetical protein
MPVINITVVNNTSIIFDGKYDGYADDTLLGLYIDQERDYIYACDEPTALIFPLNSSHLPQTPSILSLSYETYSTEKIANSSLAIGGESYTYFADISDIGNPSLLGIVYILEGERIRGIYYSEDSGMELFAVGGEGLNIIDFNPLSSPSFLGRMDSTPYGADGYGLDRKGDYILLAGGVNGLSVYNYEDCLSFQRPDQGISGYPVIFVLFSLIGISLLLINRTKKH